MFRNRASEVVVGYVEAEEALEGGYLLWDPAGEVVAREVEELEVGAVGEGYNGAVHSVVVEVYKAELVELGERAERAAEVERRE